LNRVGSRSHSLNLEGTIVQLRSLKYAESVGTPEEWVLDGLLLGPKTLLVGRNASGKSRTLSVIANLARALNGQQGPTSSGSFDCVFDDNGIEYRYKLSYKDQKVESEYLTVRNELVLTRSTGGKGEILFQNMGPEPVMHPFQSPENTIAAVVRRDNTQHGFLEPLHRWASSLRYYQFGTYLGKEVYAVFVPNLASNVDERDQNQVVGLFNAGIKRIGDQFKRSIIDDMARVGYDISDVGIAPPTAIQFNSPPGEISGLYVQENNLPGRTDQFSMSQGMFRVLSLLVHVNFAQLRKSAACVIVDDIGEGLDFDRSCKMIHLLREKAESSVVQIILSTNDKFVMNEVPLTEWAIVQRQSNHVQIRNYENSKEIFDDFRFTGLSNFSFLEMDVINTHESTIH
jgi:predicted ATPase